MWKNNLKVVDQLTICTLYILYIPQTVHTLLANDYLPFGLNVPAILPNSYNLHDSRCIVQLLQIVDRPAFPFLVSPHFSENSIRSRTSSLVSVCLFHDTRLAFIQFRWSNCCFVQLIVSSLFLIYSQLLRSCVWSPLFCSFSQYVYLFPLPSPSDLLVMATSK